MRLFRWRMTPAMSSGVLGWIPMDSTTSIHDHHIRELAVDAAQRTIRLRTAYPDSRGPDFATVVFEDVQGYVFRGDALGTILFEIEPVDSVELYREHADEMQQVCAKTGGHAAWAENESSAAAFLSAEGIRGYRISSSIGLEGAVWARRLSIQQTGQ
jgi:hypothetical protein